VYGMDVAFGSAGPRVRAADPRTAFSGSYVRWNEGLQAITCKLRRTVVKQNEYYGLQ